METRWMKRISFFLALVMLLTMLPVAALAEETEPASSTPDQTLGTPSDTSAEIPEEHVVALTATDGGRVSGGGVFTDGEEVTVTAHPSEDYDFTGWYQDEQLVSLDPVYSFKAMGAVAYQANFTSTASSYTLTMKGPAKLSEAAGTLNSDGQISLEPNTPVTLTYEGDEGTFLYWVNGNNNVVCTNPTYSFTLVNDITIEAIYLSDPTNNTRVIFRNAYAQIIKNDSYEGAPAPVSFPDTIPSKMGYTFDHWYVLEGNEKVQVSADNIIEKMSGKNHIEVFPEYKPNGAYYTVNISYEGTGGVEPSQPIYTVPVGDKQDITADAVVGKVFDHWEINETPVGYDKVYSVLRAQSSTVNLVAVYSDVKGAEVPLVHITQTYAAKSGEKYVVSNTMQYYLPEGYTLLQAGFEYYTSNSATLRRSVYSKTESRALYTFSGRFSDPEAVLYIRAYITYQQGEKTPVTDYTSKEYTSASYYGLSGTASVKKEGEKKLTASDATIQSAASPENAAPAATAVIPKDVLLDESAIQNGTVSLQVSVTPKEEEAIQESDNAVSVKAVQSTLGNTAEVTYYDVSVSGVSDENTENIIVHLAGALAPNLANVQVYHETESMYRVYAESDLTVNNRFYYDQQTGDVYLCITNFSVFTFAYKSYIKFPNVDKYLYRVGNKNAVLLSTLFKNTDDIATVTITPSSDTPNAGGSYENKQCSFTGTGVVRLTATLTNNDTITLPLEVVEATNATSAASATATAHNVVLLGNVSVNGNESIVIGSGYGLYGNGFKITCTGDGRTNSFVGMGSGYIVINGGLLDNVVVEAPDFPKAYMYTGSNSYDHYVSEIENAIDSNHYGYQLSAVCARGDTTISNSYIYGARDNIVGSGNLTVDNCTLANGSLANIQFSDENGALNLNDVTTIQYLRTVKNTINNKNNDYTVMGVGVLMGAVPGSGGSGNPTLNITGSLTQYNWVSAQDGSSITSSDIASALVSAAVGSDTFRHTVQGTQYANLGVIYLNDNSATINDERQNHGYELGSVSMSIGFATAHGKAYSVANGNGTVDRMTGKEDIAYTPGKNGPYYPVLTIADALRSKPLAGLETYCYLNDKGELEIQFPVGLTYDFDLWQYCTLQGATDYTVTCAGAVVQNGGTIVFSEGGTTEIAVVLSSNAYDRQGNIIDEVQSARTLPVKVITPDATMRDAEVIVDPTVNTKGVIISSSGNRFYWFDILDGLTIKDYDAAGKETVVLDGTAESKRAFLKLIKTVSPATDQNAIAGGNHDSQVSLRIELIDGRVLEIEIQRIDASNSPGKDSNQIYTAYVKTDSNANTLYFETGTGANNSGEKGVATKISNQTFYCQYKLFGHKFTGFSGKPATSKDNSIHIMSVGLYNGEWTAPSTSGSKPSNNYAPTAQKTVTFSAEGGSYKPTTIVTTDKQNTITLPYARHANKNLEGWYTEPSGGTRAGGAGDSYKPGATMTLYAHWTDPTVVTLVEKGVSTPVQVGAYSTLTLPDVTLTENEWFEGWLLKNSIIGKAGDGYTVPATDVTLTAKINPKLTVSFNANSETSVNPENMIYAGTPLTLPEPVNSNPNKAFVGWYSDSDFDPATLIGRNGYEYTPTANITLYAKWNTIVTVTYNANGGTVDPASAEYNGVDALTLPTPTRTGFWCTGWFSAETDGNKIGNTGDAYKPAEDITLYAQWSPEYKVNFDVNGGEGTINPMTYKGTALTLPTPTKTGYSCTGWYTEGGDEVGKPGASYSPDANITLYAHWTVNSYTVNITTSKSSTTVTNNATNATISDKSSVAYGTVVKVVLLYTEDKDLTFTIKQGNTDVAYYKDEACTTSTTSTAAGTYYFKMPAGEVTINSSSSCLAAGTLITLADGTQKPIEDIRLGDMVMTWNFDTGVMEPQPVSMYWYHGSGEYRVINLRFSNDAIVRVITEHGFFDADLNKFVFIKESTCADYIGHRFIICNADGSYETVTLDAAYLTDEETGCYSLRTAYNDNALVEGLISLTQEDYEGITTCFEVGEGLKYDSAKKQALIDTYGLYTYDEWADYMTADIFDMFNCQYYKIYVGLGILREEDFYSLLDGLYENLAQ